MLFFFLLSFSFCHKTGLFQNTTIHLFLLPAKQKLQLLTHCQKETIFHLILNKLQTRLKREKFPFKRNGSLFKGSTFVNYSKNHIVKLLKSASKHAI